VKTIGFFMRKTQMLASMGLEHKILYGIAIGFSWAVFRLAHFIAGQ
jgi:hypothetical protein